MTSRETLKLLRDYESRNVTFIDPDGSWPIVWKRAKGVYVWDAEGKRYVDLTAAFGVAAAGHANPRVVIAGQRQMATLLHAMGDVHPHELKARLARELSRLTFERWEAGRGKALFGNSGFEAVEAALKTAILATRKPGIVAFRGGYHGVGYGTLNATHRDHFRKPFLDQLTQFGFFVPFPRKGGKESLASLDWQLTSLLRRKSIGANLVEPIQVRGGINIPPAGFLSMLRRLCDENGTLLVLDEIYTGFGRTGKWFACEHEAVVPDLVCLGKALTGGFPLSACVGRSELMDEAWPASNGEAIHTSTFLGHPVGCAMALAQIGEIRRRHLVKRSAFVGGFLVKQLGALDRHRNGFTFSSRGVGLLAGLEIGARTNVEAGSLAIRCIKKLLTCGFILLPEGEHGNTISFTPPLTISLSQLASAVRALDESISTLAPGS